jgi:glycosyltransferase involved in cell wall biosynthesis
MDLRHSHAELTLDVSVVIPVFNEEGSLQRTIKETTLALNEVAGSWEIIAVDDGSTDASSAILSELHSQDSRIKIVSLRANFGQAAAMAAGVHFASGLVLVTLDADGQNDPSEIPRLLWELNHGADLVAGWRKVRHDTLLRRVPSRVANWIIAKSTGMKLHDYGCTLKAFRTEIIKEVSLIGGMHRMIPILVKRNGGRITELAVNHRPRIAGYSKYGISRTPRVIADLLVARFLLAGTSKPMYFFGTFSLFGLVTSVSSGSLAVYFKFAGLKDFVETPLPLIAIFSLMFSSLAFLSGLLAELLVRIYFQQVGPPHKIRWTLGI